MTSLVATAAIAAAVARGGLEALPKRPNFRGEELPFPAGALAIATTLLAAGPITLVDSIEDTDLWVLMVGVAVLGLLDDLLHGHGRGWRGHAKALLSGRFSTGFLKAAGTLSLAIAFLADRFHQSDLWGWTAVLVFVLATNLFNLLDLRPGRATKAWVLFAIGMFVAGETEGLEVIGPFAGPLLLFGLLDLRERCMLGDTGANLLGATAGAWMIVNLDQSQLTIAAGVLVALTIFGEFGSFSRAIERIPPLRALDSLGRKSHA